MLCCQELTERVTDYLEGRMTDEERLEFLMHTSLCRHCRAYLKQIRTIIEAAGKMPDPPAAEGAMEDALRTFRQWRSG